MRRHCLSALALLFLAFCAAAQPRPAPYYPDAAWQRRNGRGSGHRRAAAERRDRFRRRCGIAQSRDLTLNHYRLIRPRAARAGDRSDQDRGDPTGVVVHKGYIVAEWGEPSRVDMTHSVTKSLLSTSWRGVRSRHDPSIDDPVRDYVAPILAYAPGEGAPSFFICSKTPHNRKITWNHLCARQATGKARYGASPTWATGLRTAGRVRTRPRIRPGPCTSTTTCA